MEMRWIFVLFVTFTFFKTGQGNLYAFFIFPLNNNHNIHDIEEESVLSDIDKARDFILNPTMSVLFSVLADKHDFSLYEYQNF